MVGSSPPLVRGILGFRGYLLHELHLSLYASCNVVKMLKATSMRRLCTHFGSSSHLLASTSQMLAIGVPLSSHIAKSATIDVCRRRDVYCCFTLVDLVPPSDVFHPSGYTSSSDICRAYTQRPRLIINYLVHMQAIPVTQCTVHVPATPRLNFIAQCERCPYSTLYCTHVSDNPASQYRTRASCNPITWNSTHSSDVPKVLHSTHASGTLFTLYSAHISDVACSA